MKIVGICGSLRKESSSTYLVEKIVNTAIENGHEGNVHQIRNLIMNPCRACDYCAEGKGCELDDAMTDIYGEICDSGILVIGTPVYYGEVSAQTKAVIDRFYQFSLNPNKDMKKRKVIQVFTQEAADKDLYKSYFDYQLKCTYEIVNFELKDRLVAAGINNTEKLLKNKDILEKAETIGKNI
ncbi:Iron-sulfur flavoprotein [Candidatus Methanobinarius endosymbioticus]|uniref:Iron-sulfur flavoprotein n=1 Tax=Candidatus Methanobinarius endosymbioticus TaxID=2006182 RepID=A0A366M811_9EURY|nr:Iron-sulfur flavoprotein [Candidatus Methanobinarius endosymbioticus]